MAVSAWPGTLPQNVEVGYTESIGMNVIRTSMDSGPPKMRFRGKRPSTLSASMLMSSTQISTLNTFILDTINGVYKFTFPHPRLGSSTVCRFIPSSDGQFYSLSHVGLNYYKVSFQLEVVL